MKKTYSVLKRFLLTSIALLLFTGSISFAREEAPEPPPDEPFCEQPAPHPGEPPAEHIERWLEHEKMRNPEEYDRLKRLQEEDPKAFHEELAHRLGHMRMRQCFRHNPQLFEAFRELPDQEKNRIANNFFAPPPYGDGDAPGERDFGSRKHRRGKENSMRRLKPLVRQYKNAQSPKEKAEIQKQLLTELGEMFDQRTEERKQSIQQLQGQLDRLEEKLAAREAHRDDIIQNRFEELTRDDALKW